MITEDNIEVKFDGKSYIEYMKYKDKRKEKSSAIFNKWIKNNAKYLVMFCLFIAVVGLVYVALAPTPEVSQYVVDWNRTLNILVILVGISWLIHGVGFHLVKVR